MEFVVRDMYHVDVMRCGINNKDIRVIKVMRIDMEKIKMGSIVNGTDGVRFEIGNSLIDIQDCLRINGIRIEFSESIELVITQ
jgi:hypothetical protein